MLAAHIAALVVVSIATACTVPERAPSREASQSSASQTSHAVVAPAAPQPPSPPTSPQAITSENATVAVEPAKPPVTPPAATSIAKAEAPSAKAPAKVPPPAAPAAKRQTPAPVANKTEAAPPLDLASLETRLKDTKAIGVLTKLALKNQVDDLLGEFRAYYQGRLKTTLAELRKSFDLLFLKVLSLLQDSDPPLASAILASREAIWGILSDPVKFATVATL